MSGQCRQCRQHGQWASARPAPRYLEDGDVGDAVQGAHQVGLDEQVLLPGELWAGGQAAHTGCSQRRAPCLYCTDPAASPGPVSRPGPAPAGK